MVSPSGTLPWKSNSVKTTKNLTGSEKAPPQKDNNKTDFAHP